MPQLSEVLSIAQGFANHLKAEMEAASCVWTPPPALLIFYFVAKLS